MVKIPLITEEMLLHYFSYVVMNYYVEYLGAYFVAVFAFKRIDLPLSVIFVPSLRNFF